MKKKIVVVVVVVVVAVVVVVESNKKSQDEQVFGRIILISFVYLNFLRTRLSVETSIAPYREDQLSCPLFFVKRR